MATPHTERHGELVPLFAMQALDGPELAEMEDHAPACVTCRGELRRWRDVLAVVAGSEAAAPSTETRRAILTAVAPPAAAGAPDRLVSAAGWIAAGLCLFGLLASWRSRAIMVVERDAAVLARNEAQVARRDLENDLATTRDRLGQAEHQLARATAEQRLLRAPGVQAVTLAGLQVATDAAGQTFLNPGERRAVFYAFRLPPLPPGRTYQLWFIASGKPVSAGVFHVDAEGNGALEVRDVAPLESIQAWAVTEEPEGGVPQPTGAMYLKS